MVTLEYYVIANKLQAKYQRPVAILTKNKTINDKEYFYRGSMRNYSLSEIKDLKSLLESTNQIEWCAGHINAAGLSIPANNIEAINKSLNEVYKDIDQTPTYWVDYIWKRLSIEEDKILDIGELNIYGQEIPESLIVVEDIALNPTMITLMGADKGHPTLKIQLDGVSMIKFKSSQEEYEQFCQEDMVLTAVCKANVNEWNGNISPQLLIEDFELREEYIF